MEGVSKKTEETDIQTQTDKQTKTERQERRLT